MYMRIQRDEALKVQESRTDRSSRRWQNTLMAMQIYAHRYPNYDFKFILWVRETMQDAGIGYVKTRPSGF